MTIQKRDTVCEIIFMNMGQVGLSISSYLLVKSAETSHLPITNHKDMLFETWGYLLRWKNLRYTFSPLAPFQRPASFNQGKISWSWHTYPPKKNVSLEEKCQTLGCSTPRSKSLSNESVYTGIPYTKNEIASPPAADHCRHCYHPGRGFPVPTRTIMAIIEELVSWYIFASGEKSSRAVLRTEAGESW